MSVRQAGLPARDEASTEELGRLAEVMQQVAALAPLNQTEEVWIEDVRVGDAVVKLGLRPGGEALVRIMRLPRRD